MREHALHQSPASPPPNVSDLGDVTGLDMSSRDDHSEAEHLLDSEMDDTVETEREESTPHTATMEHVEEGKISIPNDEIETSRQTMEADVKELETDGISATVEPEKTENNATKEEKTENNATKEDINENYTKSIVAQSETEVKVALVEKTETETKQNVVADESVSDTASKINGTKTTETEK